MTTSIVTSTYVISDAEAIKGEEVSSSKYGSATKEQVCGDRLCSEIPDGRQAYEEKDTEISPTVTQKRMAGETCNCAGEAWVLLPSYDDLYKGMVTYSASENIQLVVLHGPLDEGEDK